MRPILFLDMDDVLVISQTFTSYQVITTFKSADLDDSPELWSGLIFPQARDNLAALHKEFFPHYIVSSSWSNYLTRLQMEAVFRRTGLEFVADNMHEQWTTPKSNEWTRLDEIENWISQHGYPAQPMLVIDDLESGRSLRKSSLHLRGLVVLCDAWTGLVADKLLDAQKRLRAQTSPERPCP